MASRLTAFSKDCGVHPIGISEVYRRLISKAVMNVIRQDILAATGCQQVCVVYNNVLIMYTCGYYL